MYACLCAYMYGCMLAVDITDLGVYSHLVKTIDKDHLFFLRCLFFFFGLRSVSNSEWLHKDRVNVSMCVYAHTYTVFCAYLSEFLNVSVCEKISSLCKYVCI
jgi:hypothetical protein